MVRMRALSFALAAALAWLLAGCDGPNPFSRMSEPNMTPLSPKLQKLFEKTKPVCFGRFVIDVPVTTEVAWGPAHAEYPLETYPDQAHKVKAEIDARLAHYAKERHRTAPSMLVAVRDGPHPGSKIIVGYPTPLYDGLVEVNGYFALRPHAFVMTAKSVVIEDWQAIVRALQDVASRLRVRKEEEIPAEPGICIEGGFIAEGEGKYYELISIGFRILPDVHFSIQTIRADEPFAESSSLPYILRRGEKRVRALGLFDVYKRVKWFRKAERTLLGDQGYEALGRNPPDYNEGAHEFRYIALGRPKNPLMPLVDIKLDTGAEGSQAGEVAPSLTDEEAVALWDRLLASIRPRPGAMVPGWVPPSGR